MSEPVEIEAWRQSGQLLDVEGRKVFARVEGEGSASPILFLHGFPTCSYDLKAAAPLLAKGRKLVMHDHLGLGLSDKPLDYSYSLFEQADVAIAVWRQLGITRGHLLAHDIGTSIATELLARHRRGLLPIALDSATLCNGSMIFELARLRWTQKVLKGPLGPLFARVSSERLFSRQLQRIFSRPDSVPARELQLAWWLLNHNDGKRVMPLISRYHDERVRFRARWVDELPRLKLPVHLLWAKKDPIAVPEIAERVAALIPGSRLTWLETLGHYPMLEDPTRWAVEVLKFVDRA